MPTNSNPTVECHKNIGLGTCARHDISHIHIVGVAKVGEFVDERDVDCAEAVFQQLRSLRVIRITSRNSFVEDGFVSSTNEPSPTEILAKDHNKKSYLAFYKHYLSSYVTVNNTDTGTKESSVLSSELSDNFIRLLAYSSKDRDAHINLLTNMVELYKTSAPKRPKYNESLSFLPFALGYNSLLDNPFCYALCTGKWASELSTTSDPKKVTSLSVLTFAPPTTANTIERNKRVESLAKSDRLLDQGTDKSKLEVVSTNLIVNLNVTSGTQVLNTLGNLQVFLGSLVHQDTQLPFILNTLQIFARPLLSDKGKIWLNNMCSLYEGFATHVLENISTSFFTMADFANGLKTATDDNTSSIPTGPLQHLLDQANALAHTWSTCIQLGRLPSDFTPKISSFVFVDNKHIQKL